MMGFGFLSMLLVIALPIVAVVVLVIWLSNPNRQGNPFYMNPPIEKREPATGPSTKRFCSHCVAGLQGDWTHCPQCGAPIKS
ncbi:MAG: hypothetical protein Kow002_14350 [Anaerolineales bacterium]